MATRRLLPRNVLPSTALTRGIVRLLPVILLFAASGCCCSFHREWNAAAQCPPSDGLEGRWEGTWCSNSNGHNGKLKAVFKRSSPNCYKAYYYATFAGCIPFWMETDMQVRQAGSVYHLGGEQDLGCLAGGKFEYNGTARSGRFRANFSALDDHGIFSMSRVDAGDGCADCGGF